GVAPGEILRAVGLAGVFDYYQVVAFREFEDGVHVRGLAVEVNGHYGPHRQTELAVHQCAGSLIDLAFGFEVLGQLARIHVVGPLIDIDEIGPGAGLGDGFRGGDEGVRDGQDDGAGSDARGDQGEAEGVRAAADADAMLGGAVGGEVTLKLFDHGAADEGRGFQGPAEDGRQLVLY